MIARALAVLLVASVLQAPAEAPLPPWTVTRSEECGQLTTATYTYSTSTLTLCRPLTWPRGPYVLIHEMGHHLDNHLLTDADREYLMDLWGLDTWRGHHVTWSLRGAEVFAEAVAWFLWGQRVHDIRYRLSVPESQLAEALSLLGRYL